jgi:hypothetical protein
VIGSTTTAGGGFYQFAGLLPGTYSVQFFAPPGSSFTAQYQGGNSTTDSNPNPTTGLTDPFTLGPGEVNLTIDAGLLASSGGSGGVVGDWVWSDLNGNGIQDPGEPGVDGVGVQLLDGSGAVVGSTTTAGGGFYQFAGLLPGTYSVQFVVSPPFHFTAQYQGGNPATDSNPNPATGLTDPFTLGSGEINPTIDAGLLASSGGSGGLVGDWVWNDLNGNGIQDPGEFGVDGVGVQLLNGNGAVVGSTMTTGGGFYQFANVLPGTYSVQFFAPPGSAFTAQYQGGNPATDSNPNPATGRTDPFTLGPGEMNRTIDAGLLVSSGGSGGSGGTTSLTALSEWGSSPVDPLVSAAGSTGTSGPESAGNLPMVPGSTVPRSQAVSANPDLGGRLEGVAGLSGSGDIGLSGLLAVFPGWDSSLDGTLLPKRKGKRAPA